MMEPSPPPKGVSLAIQFLFSLCFFALSPVIGQDFRVDVSPRATGPVGLFYPTGVTTLRFANAS